MIVNTHNVDGYFEGLEKAVEYEASDMQLIEAKFNAQAASIASMKAMPGHIMKQLGFLATPLAVLQVATNGLFEFGSTGKFHFPPFPFLCHSHHWPLSQHAPPIFCSHFHSLLFVRQQGMFTPVSVCVWSSPFRSNDLLQCPLANCPCPRLPFRFLPCLILCLLFQ